MRQASTSNAAKPLQVVVLTPLGLGGKGGIDRLMDQINIVVTDRLSDRVEVSYYKTRGEGSLAHSMLLTIQAARALATRKAAGTVDVAHINVAHSGSVYRKIFLAGVCRSLGIPYVIHLHGSRFRQTWDGASPRLSHALAKMFARSAATLVLGRVWADYVAGKVPAARDKLLIFPTAARDHGIPATPREDGKVRVLFSGKLGERKGSRQFVDALGRIAANPDWRADMTGNGEIDETRAAVTALGLSDRVSVPGWVSDETHAALSESADILALPSFDENLPLSVVEAFSRGIAVVATPVGAVAEIVQDGETGLLVEPGDTQALAAAMLRLVEDPALRKRLGGNGRKVFELRLDVDVYTDKLLKVWEDAAAQGGDA